MSALEQQLQQLTAAIQCSLNPSSLNQAAEATTFLNNVKTSQSGWQYFLELFTRCHPTHQQDVAFVCVGSLCDVVRAVPFASHSNSHPHHPNQNHTQHNQQANATSPEKTLSSSLLPPPPPFLRPIREVLLRWFESNVTQGTLQYQPKFLKTKIALLYVLLLKTEYPHSWDNPFTFLFASLNVANQPRPLDSIDFFFRITKVMMEEVVAFDQSRHRDEIQRNVEVKQAMKREHVVKRIVDVFVQVMRQHCTSSGSMDNNNTLPDGGSGNGTTGVASSNGQGVRLLSLCLRTMSEWIGWMDLNLVVQNIFLTPLFQCLGSPSLRIRIETVVCLRELVDKNMSSVARVSLLSKVGLVNVLIQYGIPRLRDRQNKMNEFDAEMEDAEELAEELASLVNSLAYRLICCRDVLIGVSEESQTYVQGQQGQHSEGWTVDSAAQLDGMLEHVLTLLWAWFQHSYVEVAEETLSSMQALVKTMAREQSNRVPYPERSRLRTLHSVPVLLQSLERALQYPTHYTHHGTSCLNGVGSQFHAGGHGAGTGTATLAKRGEMEGSEEDASFDAFRDRVEPIFVNLVRIQPEICLSYVASRASAVFTLLQQQNGVLAGRGISTGSSSGTVNNMNNIAISGNAAITASPPGLQMEELETVLLLIRLCRSAPNIVQNENFINIVRSIHLGPSKIPTLQHRALLLEYFEVSLKYHHVLSSDSDCLGVVLSTFCDGLAHNDPTVRGQCCYHLRMLCKQLSSNLKSNEMFVQTLLQRIHGHLTVPMSTSESVGETALSFPDRLHLYDVSGLLISRCVSDDHTSTVLMKTVLSPLLQALTGGVPLWHQQQQGATSTEDISAATISASTSLSTSSSTSGSGSTSPTLLSNPNDDAVMYLARCVQAVGFTTKTMPTSSLPFQIRDMYRCLLEASLRVLSTYPVHTHVRTQVIFLFHRMVACLGEHLVQYLPSTLPPLIQTTNAKNAVETFQLVNQLLSKYRLDNQIHQIIHHLALPIITQLFRIMPNCTARSSASQAPTDDQILSESLQRVFVLFLQNVVCNQLSMVFATAQALPYLSNILTALLRACTNVPDPNVAKSTFIILRQLVEQWLLTTDKVDMATANGNNGNNNNISNGDSGNRNGNMNCPEEAKRLLTGLLLNEGCQVMLSVLIRQGYDAGDAAMTLSMHKEVIQLQRTCVCSRMGVQYVDTFCTMLTSAHCNQEMMHQYRLFLTNLTLTRNDGGQNRQNNNGGSRNQNHKAFRTFLAQLMKVLHERHHNNL